MSDNGNISEDRLKANRENAKKSTGPKSKEGKARSAGNARKHDIFSQGKLLPPSDRKKLRRLRRQLFAELQPNGVLQKQCINELALTLFRRSRIARWESARIAENVRQAQEKLEKEECDDDDDFLDEEDDGDVIDNKKPPKLTKVAIAAVSMVDEHELGLITRYERPLEKKAERLLAQFKRLQTERKSGNQ